MRKPNVFLLDEPLSALDAALRLELRAELVNLQKQMKATMVFVTHDQIEAMTMGDRIAVMRKGAVEQIGTPNDIYARPRTLFVAAFVGSPPMNFFAGKIAMKDRPEFLADAVKIALPSKAGLFNFKDGRSVVVGVRPEHLALCKADDPSALAATVYALEKLGRESVLILESKPFGTIRLLVEAQASFNIGDVVHFKLALDQAHLFDEQTGQAIEHFGNQK